MLGLPSAEKRALNDLWSMLVLFDVASGGLFLQRWKMIIDIYDVSDIPDKDQVKLKEAFDLFLAFREGENEFRDHYNTSFSPHYNNHFGLDWTPLEALVQLSSDNMTTLSKKHDYVMHKGYNSKILK